MIIDDGYLKKGPRLKRKGYQHYKNHQASQKELTAMGDLMVREINTGDLNHTINRDYLDLITRRGEELIKRDPELEAEIRSYIKIQKEECDMIDQHIEGTVWLMQKKG